MMHRIKVGVDLSNLIPIKSYGSKINSQYSQYSLYLENNLELQINFFLKFVLSCLDMPLGSPELVTLVLNFLKITHKQHMLMYEDAIFVVSRFYLYIMTVVHIYYKVNLHCLYGASVADMLTLCHNKIPDLINKNVCHMNKNKVETISRLNYILDFKVLIHDQQI